MSEIVSKDIVPIRALLNQVFGQDDYRDLSRLGGLTNHTYRVVMPDGEEYVVRLPGEGTEEMIVRRDEEISTRLACDLGVDAELLYFGSDGAKITRYIPNAQTMSSETIKDPVRIRQVSEIFRKIHSCGVDTKVPFEVFDMAAGYEKIIFDKSVPMFSDYDSIKKRVMEIKNEISNLICAKKVPCHNDPLCENWVVGDDKMYLIDWEYAGMNDGMWDLADVSIEAGFDSECDRLLLESYLAKTPDLTNEKHFLASKIYVDFLWTLWAKARVPYDGQPMEDWAVERYERLKNFILEYDRIGGKTL